MALHLKSNKSFKILIGLSALLISSMAATFSVTGIATLFSGYFFTVALMMGALEFGKIVVASFLARNWTEISKSLKVYFFFALTVLILITSGGIFGYLSDAYQRTKGDFSIVENEIKLINSKIQLFNSEKDRLQNRIDVLISSRQGQETRLDSLYSRGRNLDAKRVEQYVKSSDAILSELSIKLNSVNDSIGIYESRKIEKESVNIKGELGPLKYIAVIFNTDMDTVVKYFIFMLIFVFDPLAILLFVSINMLIRKEHENYDDSKSSVNNSIFNKRFFEKIKEPINKIFNKNDNTKSVNVDEIVNKNDIKQRDELNNTTDNNKIITTEITENKNIQIEEEDIKKEKSNEQIEQEKPQEHIAPQLKIEWGSANFHGQ